MACRQLWVTARRVVLLLPMIAVTPRVWERRPVAILVAPAAGLQPQPVDRELRNSDLRLKWPLACRSVAATLTQSAMAPLRPVPVRLERRDWQSGRPAPVFACLNRRLLVPSLD